MLPKVILFALATLVTFAAIPDRVYAAPVIKTQAASEPACTTGSVAPECLTVVSAGSAFSLLKAGGLLLGGAAATTIQASESIMPVPLPAAGWLLVAGLGALGLFGRRRDALSGLRGGTELEPLGSALRGSAGVEYAAGAHRHFVNLHPGGLRHLSDALTAARGSAGRWSAFGFGIASPVRPVGGAGMLWSTTAERAPPACRIGRGDIHPPRDFDCSSFLLERLQGMVSVLAARLVCLDDTFARGIGLAPVSALVLVLTNQPTDFGVWMRPEKAALNPRRAWR